jgi:hypothetical protein
MRQTPNVVLAIAPTESRRGEAGGLSLLLLLS